MLTKIAIKNFRSLVNVTVEPKGLTLFVGINDIGKSNILRALNLFFNDQTDLGRSFKFEEDFATKAVSKKKKQIEISLTFDLGSRYKKGTHDSKYIVWTKTWNKLEKSSKFNFENSDLPVNGNLKLADWLKKFEFKYVPAIRDTKFFIDLFGQLYDVISANSNSHFKKSTSDFEKQVGTSLQQLTHDISRAFSTTAKFAFPDNLRTIFEDLELTINNTPLDRHGDGVKVRQVPFLLKFMFEQQQKNKKKGNSPYHTIWGFEEPENNLEISAALDLAKQLNKWQQNNSEFLQIFLTTHSPIFYEEVRHNHESTQQTYRVALNESKRVDVTPITSKTSLELDPINTELGLMQFLGPHLKQKTEEYEKLKQQHANAKNELKNLQSKTLEGKPVIFLEGATDVLVYKSAWNCFSNYPEKVIIIDSKSASGVSSLAMAWALQLKFKSPKAKYNRCYTLFDNDDAGIKARNKLSAWIDSEGYANDFPHQNKMIAKCPEWFAEQQQTRMANFLKPTFCLEHYYSIDIWKIAYSKNLLEEKQPIDYLKPETLNQLLKKSDNEENSAIKCLTDNPNSTENLPITHTFKSSKKLETAKRVIENPEKYLTMLKPTIEMIEKFLKPALDELCVIDDKKIT